MLTMNCALNCLQIFTNADKAHVAKVLSRLGLEDCFDGVICFETLNPPVEDNEENGDSNLRRRVLCKPSLEAMEAVIRIVKIDPKKTVRPMSN